MRVRLDYGRVGLDVQLPEDRVVYTLAYPPAPALADPDSETERVLRQPSGTRPLAELARGRRDACVVICDITRPVPNELLLRPLLATLEAAGIARDKILILVATGMHRACTPAEIREMVGPEIAASYRIENHDGQAIERHSYLGESPHGVPVHIDTRYVQADLKIAVGLIEPHFMAGFSGGRKVICPGIAAWPTIRVTHSPDFLEHHQATTAVLEGNPVHHENTWIARHVGCDFIVNVVIDAQRQALRIVAGDLEAAFEEGAEFVRRLVTVPIPEPVDVVITSGAGYPLDTTFYQSVKGMVAALPIIKEGGTVILAASMSEGIGSAEFARLFHEHASLEAFMTRILAGSCCVIDQWQLEELARLARRARVRVVTDGLPAETIRGLFVDSAPSVEEAIADALQEHGPHARLAVIPKGPYVVPALAPAREHWAR